jgi:Glycosyl-transferase for dystroglycan
MTPTRRDKNRAQQSHLLQQPTSNIRTTAGSDNSATAAALSTMVTVRNLQLVTVAMLIIVLFHSVLDYRYDQTTFRDREEQDVAFHDEQDVVRDHNPALNIIRAVDKAALSDTSSLHQSSLVRTAAFQSMDNTFRDSKVAKLDTKVAKLSKDTYTNPYNFSKFFETAPSCHAKLEPNDVDFTLVLQSSLDRLWLMQHHCARWTGPISLAVYVGYQTKNAVSAASIRRTLLHDYQCTRDESFLSIVTMSGYSDKTFPTNALRNAALSAVTTSHVVSLDIDFWFPLHLHQDLRDNFASAVASNHKLALVLPAFELVSNYCQGGNHSLDCQERNIALMPSDKAQLLRLWRDHGGGSKQRAEIFHASCKLCHGSTRYAEWREQADHELLPIDCVTSAGYEPYLAFRYCRELPPFQEAFTGYGRNKHAWMVQTRRSGYEYQQVGGGYVIHFPHAFSKARRHFSGSDTDRLMSFLNISTRGLTKPYPMRR